MENVGKMDYMGNVYNVDIPHQTDASRNLEASLSVGISDKVETAENLETVDCLCAE
ncbi:MAG: hypothetical protein GY765_32435 [bacterium]|nr:hypothetical protein [bacterium]